MRKGSFNENAIQNMEIKNILRSWHHVYFRVNFNFDKSVWCIMAV